MRLSTEGSFLRPIYELYFSIYFHKLNSNYPNQEPITCPNRLPFPAAKVLTACVYWSAVFHLSNKQNGEQEDL